MCDGGLLLHPQYEAVQIGSITQFPAMGIQFSLLFLVPLNEDKSLLQKQINHATFISY